MRVSILASVSALLLCLGAAPHQADKDKVPEVHIVAVHEGVKKTGNVVHEPKAFVEVNRPGKRVTLVLDAYNEVQWGVSVVGGTKLEKVILCGYHRQTVTGLPKDVPVEERFHYAKQGKYVYIGYQIDSLRFRVGLAAVAKLTGREVSSYQGTYSYRSEKVLAVNKVQDDPRLRSDYPRPADPADVPKLRFRAFHYVGEADRPHATKASYGEFTQKGPVADTLKVPPQGVNRLAYDPDAKKYYGIGGHKIYEVDLEKKKAAALKWDQDLGELSWPSDVTFDTKRKRLVLSISTGGGKLFAYSPAKKEWSLLAPKWTFDATVYHPKHDALYGLVASPHGGEKRPLLVRFNADAAVVKEAELSDPAFPGCLASGPGVARTQFVPVEDRLVILGSPGRHGEPGALPGVKTFLFVVDPETGKVQLAWKER
jgi:hypothetical protein